VQASPRVALRSLGRRAGLEPYTVALLWLEVRRQEPPRQGAALGNPTRWWSAHRRRRGAAPPSGAGDHQTAASHWCSPTPSPTRVAWSYYHRKEPSTDFAGCRSSRATPSGVPIADRVNGSGFDESGPGGDDHRRRRDGAGVQVERVFGREWIARSTKRSAFYQASRDFNSRGPSTRSRRWRSRRHAGWPRSSSRRMGRGDGDRGRSSASPRCSGRTPGGQRARRPGVPGGGMGWWERRSRRAHPVAATARHAPPAQACSQLRRRRPIDGIKVLPVVEGPGASRAGCSAARSPSSSPSISSTCSSHRRPSAAIACDSAVSRRLEHVEEIDW